MNCLKSEDILPIKVRKVFLYKNGNLRIHVGKTKILAHPSHQFTCFLNGTKEIIKAKDITINNYLYVAVSLLKSGDLVMTDKGLRKIKSLI